MAIIGGYIPDAVMEKAEKEIKKAYAKGHINDVDGLQSPR